MNARVGKATGGQLFCAGRHLGASGHRGRPVARMGSSFGLRPAGIVGSYTRGVFPIYPVSDEHGRVSRVYMTARSRETRSHTFDGDHDDDLASASRASPRGLALGLVSSGIRIWQVSILY